MTDLDELLPEDEKISFTVDGEKYIIKIFIPFAVGQLLIENSETLMSIFPKAQGAKPKLNADTLKIILKILRGIMAVQYPHMTEEWIQKNISLPRMAIIIYKAAIPIYQYLSQMGEVKELMTPERNQVNLAG